MSLSVICPESAAGAGLGDSISVNGVCLTVTSINHDSVEMDVGEETFRRTSLSSLKVSDSVNIEPALKVGDPLGGHIVTGHVDATGKIISVKSDTTQTVYAIGFPPELRKYIAEKGSVAVDGISLTVGGVGNNSFEVYIIPHTLDRTTLATKITGDAVNLEVDVLARYVVNAMNVGTDSKSDLMRKLKEYGYAG